MRHMTSLLLSVLTLLALPAQAESDRFAKVEIKTQKVTDNIYMLVGAGGNIGVSHGADGLLMIDDQYAPLSTKIKAALSKISDDAPTFVLNTHYHGDHTGGNENFGESSIIMAHHNVRVRLLNEETIDHALPVITYAENAKVHFNGEELDLIHKPNGHTDGDTMVHFVESNVVHMGDNFFNGKFPYVDLKAGGSVDGLIDAIEFMLKKMDTKTLIIPGHGPLGNKSDLQKYLTMLKETKSHVQTSLTHGLSEDEILKKGLPDKWDSWSKDWFMTEERWLQTLYQSYK